MHSVVHTAKTQQATKSSSCGLLYQCCIACIATLFLIACYSAFMRIHDIIFCVYMV